MPEPLLTKDAINIAGHKLPLPVVGAVVGVLGLVLVLRARSQGASVASVGTAGVLPDTTSVGVLGQDQEAQLANLSQQLFDIGQQLNPPAGTSTSTTAGAPILVGAPLGWPPLLGASVSSPSAPPVPLRSPNWGALGQQIAIPGTLVPHSTIQPASRL